MRDVSRHQHDLTRTDKVGSQQGTHGARQHCAKKICNAISRVEVRVFRTHLRSETGVFRGARSQSVTIQLTIGVSKSKENVAGQGQPKDLNAWPVLCLSFS